MSNRFAILVEGIDDPSLVGDVQRAIRDSFREMTLPGSWRVIVTPSPVSGRWDFRVDGLDVRHMMSISVAPELLPSLIPRRLQESLDRLAINKAADTAQRTLDPARSV